VALCHDPSEPEANLSISPQPLQHHAFLKPFTMPELNHVIFFLLFFCFWSLSPLMLRHLPLNALELLLSILNYFLITQQLPPSWASLRVILIPKANSTTSFQPIPLSSFLCKIFELLMLKTSRS